MNEAFELRPKNELKKEVEYFTLKGHQDFLDDQGNPRSNGDGNDVLAKKICYYDENNSVVVAKTRYQIKIGAYGRIFNPIGMYSEGNANKFSSKSGKEEWRMKEVNESIFNLYVAFLKTKNVAHLTLAERGLQ
jgi:hypothetical protein